MGCGASSHLQQTTTPVVAALVYAQSHQQAGGASASSGGALHDAAAAKVHAADNTTTSVATSDTPRDGAFPRRGVGRPRPTSRTKSHFFFPRRSFPRNVTPKQNKTREKISNHQRRGILTSSEKRNPNQSSNKKGDLKSKTKPRTNGPHTRTNPKQKLHLYYICNPRIIRPIINAVFILFASSPSECPNLSVTLTTTPLVLL